VLRKLVYLLTGFLVVLGLHYVADSMQAQAPPKNTHQPHYTADGRLEPPLDYREWIFLSSGIDMSYNPRAMAMNHSMFDNVFVNPEAYKAFLETGAWPDKTMLVLEVRGAETKGSINHAGKFQNVEFMGMEVHIKDEARFPGKWAFFGFDDEKPSKMIPTSAECYACHQQHAAVDTTFVQFYPTLLTVAKKKNTLSPAYAKEAASAEKPQ
jgi:Cytochrome P460